MVSHKKLVRCGIASEVLRRNWQLNMGRCPRPSVVRRVPPCTVKTYAVRPVLHIHFRLLQLSDSGQLLQERPTGSIQLLLTVLVFWSRVLLLPASTIVSEPQIVPLG